MTSRFRYDGRSPNADTAMQGREPGSYVSRLKPIAGRA